MIQAFNDTIKINALNRNHMDIEMNLSFYTLYKQKLKQSMF